MGCSTYCSKCTPGTRQPRLRQTLSPQQACVALTGHARPCSQHMMLLTAPRHACQPSVHQMQHGEGHEVTDAHTAPSPPSHLVAAALRLACRASLARCAAAAGRLHSCLARCASAAGVPLLAAARAVCGPLPWRPGSQQLLLPNMLLLLLLLLSCPGLCCHCLQGRAPAVQTSRQTLVYH